MTTENEERPVVLLACKSHEDRVDIAWSVCERFGRVVGEVKSITLSDPINYDDTESVAELLADLNAATLALADPAGDLPVLGSVLWMGESGNDTVWHEVMDYSAWASGRMGKDVALPLDHLIALAVTQMGDGFTLLDGTAVGDVTAMGTFRSRMATGVFVADLRPDQLVPKAWPWDESLSEGEVLARQFGFESEDQMIETMMARNAESQATETLEEWADQMIESGYGEDEVNLLLAYDGDGNIVVIDKVRANTTDAGDTDPHACIWHLCEHTDEVDCTDQCELPS